MYKNLFNKKSLKKERGITLIALIITIIILVILAAVSVAAVYNMGIVNYAVNGSQNYAKAAVVENRMLGDTGNLIGDTLDKLDEIKADYKVELVEEYAAEVSVIYIYTNNTEVAFKYKGEYLYDITDAGYKYEGNSYKRVYGLVIEKTDKVNRKELEEVAYDEELVPKVSYEIEYDINGDGKVASTDATMITQIMKKGIIVLPSRGQSTFLKADINKNKKVEESDKQTLINYFTN